MVMGEAAGYFNLMGIAQKRQNNHQKSSCNETGQSSRPGGKAS
jgi:hypothetical protein